MNIVIDDNYRLISDSMNVIIQRKHTVDPTKSPAFNPDKHSSEIREEWRDFKYCSTVEKAIDTVLEYRIRESSATSLRAVRDEIMAFRRHIHGLMHEVG